MNLRHVGLAGLVIASVAVSACSNGAASETRSWPTPSPVGVTETVGETAPAAPPVWVTPSWTGKVNENDSDTRDQFGAVPTPGIVIAQQNGKGSPYRCTLGVAVRAVDNTSGFLTAGHCDEHPGNALQLYPTADVSGDDARVLPRTYVPVSKAAGVDAALVPLDELTPAATVIAGRYRVAGVLTAAGVQQLVPPGTTVCVDGAVTGLHCGPRIADRDGRVAFAVATREGDSGAPVFAVDAQNRAALIGIVKGGDGGSFTATYLDAALLATGTAAQLDPTVIAFDGPGFSRWIATK